MTIFNQALQNSGLLSPWVNVARLAPEQIAQWLDNSWPGRVVKAIRPSETSPLAKIGKLLQAALPFGVACLFIAQSFMETGKIGAIVVGLFGLGLLGWFLNAKRTHHNRLTGIDLVVMTFLTSSIVSTAFSSFTHTSWVGLVKMLIFMSGYAVFRWLGCQGGRSTIVTRLLWLLALIGLFESVVGFYQFVMHVQPLATWNDPTMNSELKMDRIFGTLKPYNPNLLAGFLTPCFAASAGLTMLYLKRKTWLFSAGFLLASIAILIALVLTGSRGGFLAIGTMMITFFGCMGHLIWNEDTLIKYRRWLKPAWVIILLACILGLSGGILSSEKLRARVVSIFAMREDSSISYRLNVYNSAMQMAKDNPVVGIGPGNGTFKLVYGLYMVPGYNALGAYSVPLEVAVEQGLIGLFIFLSMFLILIVRTFLTLDHLQIPTSRKILMIALLAGILGSFAYGVFDTIWYRPSVNLLFWFMVASLAALSEPPADVNIFRGKLY